MTNLEVFISEQISTLITDFDKIEFRSNIGDSSYSIEFFITINGKRMQCFDMIDDGIFEEKELDEVLESIAYYVRSTSQYRRGTINKIVLTIMK